MRRNLTIRCRRDCPDGPRPELKRSAGSVTCMGILDGKVRVVGTGKAEKGADRSNLMKGEFVPAPERAAQYPCFSARVS